MCLDKTRGNEVRSETNYFKKLRFVVERSTYARMVLRRIINTTLIATDIMAGFKRPSMHDNIILETVPIASQEGRNLQHSTISLTLKEGCSIIEGFHLIHLLLDESYVRIFTQSFIYVNQAY